MKTIVLKVNARCLLLSEARVNPVVMEVLFKSSLLLLSERSRKWASLVHMVILPSKGRIVSSNVARRMI